MSSPASSDEYDAAETFAAALMDQVDKESVRNMVTVQKDMLSRFEKTNEMLINFNILSGNRYNVTSQQFRQHTQLMYDMKKDLDSIFKRIRVIKEKIRKVHPDSFKVGNTATIPEDDEESEVNRTDVVNDNNADSIATANRTETDPTSSNSKAPETDVTSSNSKAPEGLAATNSKVGLDSRRKVIVKDPEASGHTEHNDNGKSVASNGKSASKTQRSTPRYVQVPERKMTIN